MSGFLGRRRGGDHELARELAAVRITEALEPDDEAWLEEHLDRCGACRSVAEAYVDQRDELRRLAWPQPPRDLWARTSVALDELDRRSPRQGRPRRGQRLGRGISPAVLGTLSAALVVAVVIGSTLLAGGLRPPPPSATAPNVAIGSPRPSPIDVSPADVVWASHQDDGTYALNVAAVDRVCPTDGAQGCAPLDASARKLVALGFRPKAVVLSQNRPEAVVVGPGTNGRAASVFVVSLPASSQPGASPSAAIPSGSASLSASAIAPTPTATPSATASTASPGQASSSPTPRLSPSSFPAQGSPSATPSGTSPASSKVPSGSPTSSAPTSGVTTSILDDVVLVGEGAYSSDGTWFAFSARPVDGSHGPDIYVWRVGEPRARPITFDHASVFSSWLGDRILGSDIVAETAAGTTGQPAPSTNGQAASELPAGPSPTETATAAPTASPAPARTATSTGPITHAPASTAAPSSGSFGGTPAGSATSASPAEATTMVPRSFAIDPLTAVRLELGDGIWRPVVDPTGTLVLFWRGRMAYDSASFSWLPAQGDLYLAPWTAIAPADLLPSVSPSISSTTPSPSASPNAASTGTVATPSPSVVSGATASTPEMPAASSAPSEAGTPGSASGSPSQTESPALLVPQLLSPSDEATGRGPTSWDAHWDSTGSHLAIWAADIIDPAVGRLSLLTIDRLAARADPAAALLEATPALPGFSIEVDRLAWVTPPGQDGEGSQLEVLAWTGRDAGQIQSLPIPGNEQLVVAR